MSGPIVRASRENFDRWLHELRTTSVRQLMSSLLNVDGYGRVTEACCLGIGACVTPGVEVEPLIGTAFPPSEFADWLGVTGATGVRRDEGVNLIVDWPRDLLLRNYVGDEASDSGLSPYAERISADDSGFSPYAERISAAELNDEWGLSFSQIADVFDYFGIEGVEWEEG